MVLSIGFKVSVSLHFAIQATRLLILASAGIVPAERVRLSWTHNRTCRSPASKSRRNRILLRAGIAFVVVALAALLADKFWISKHLTQEKPVAATSPAPAPAVAARPAVS